MTVGLRRSLWNIIEPWIFEAHYGDEYERRTQWVWNFHAVPVTWTTNQIPTEPYRAEAISQLSRWFLTDAAADDIYDFVEALPRMVIYGLHAATLDELKPRSKETFSYGKRLIEGFVAHANQMLEREGSPYR
jgi:hypothetical protein